MSRNAINLTFPITPKAKQSFRISKHGHHKDPAVEKYQEAIKAMALAQTDPSERNQSVMLFVSVEFVYSWPKTWAKGRLAKAQESICYRIARPDVDNLCKGVFDALNGLYGSMTARLCASTLGRDMVIVTKSLCVFGLLTKIT